MEVRETQKSRENEIEDLFRRQWPELELVVRAYHSGDHYENAGWSLRFRLRVAPEGWIGKLFGKNRELYPFLEVSGCTEKSNFVGLNLSQAWCDVALHLYDRSHLERTQDLASQIGKLTGKPVIVVLES